MTIKMFSESDFGKLQITKCNKSYVHDFLKVINGETLGKKVAVALRLKKQGHFNQAMLNITEANRDQVLAVREIQCILDKPGNRNKTEIVFENFRQSLPLQIGISNGKDVLELLDKIKITCEGILPERISELHHNEENLDMMNEELIFLQERMKEKITDEELNASKEKAKKIAGKVYLAKKSITNNLIDFVTEKYSTLTVDDRLSLIRNLYRVITSSIGTMDSKLVKV